MSIRLSPANNFYAKKLAFHPNPSVGICVRAEPDFILVIWRDGSRRIPYDSLPNAILDDRGAQLPLKLTRPFLAMFARAKAVDVDFMK
jgi:hypothetical protein